MRMTDYNAINEALQGLLDSIITHAAYVTQDVDDTTDPLELESALPQQTAEYLCKRILDNLIYNSLRDSKWHVTKTADIVSEMEELMNAPGEWTNYREESLERKTNYLEQLELRKASIDALCQIAKDNFNSYVGHSWAPRATATEKRDASRQTASMTVAEAKLAKYRQAS